MPEGKLRESVAEYFQPGASEMMGTTGVGVLPPPPELPPPPLDVLEQAVATTKKRARKKTLFFFMKIIFYTMMMKFGLGFHNKRTLLLQSHSVGSIR
jgi:hypothetical protein